MAKMTMRAQDILLALQLTIVQVRFSESGFGEKWGFDCDFVDSSRFACSIPWTEYSWGFVKYLYNL